MRSSINRTTSDECSKAPQKAARAPAARKGDAEAARRSGRGLAEAEALRLQARQEDLNVWEMEKVRQSRKGSKTFT
ncbi:MAG TPA: hypothetical protein VMY43_01145 [Methanothrix sp.]|nr:hypothetical protein [Methanothrix sp.]